MIYNKIENPSFYILLLRKLLDCESTPSFSKIYVSMNISQVESSAKLNFIIIKRVLNFSSCFSSAFLGH